MEASRRSPRCIPLVVIPSGVADPARVMPGRAVRRAAQSRELLYLGDGAGYEPGDGRSRDSLRSLGMTNGGGRTRDDKDQVLRSLGVTDTGNSARDDDERGDPDHKTMGPRSMTEAPLSSQRTTAYGAVPSAAAPFARYTAFPPTYVASTFVASTLSGATRMMSWSSTTKSAYLPGVSEPRTSSWNAA